MNAVSSPSGVRGEAPAENGFYAHLRSERSHLEHLFQYQLVGHGILENQIQALSRTFRHRFKDFQGPCLFSKTLQALKIWKKIQGLSRTHKSPDFITFAAKHVSSHCTTCVGQATDFLDAKFL